MDKILIADDDNIDRKLLETYLQDSSFEVVSKTNGEEAWNHISSSDSPPQIIIIDWLMPEMDGITLCKKIRGMQSPHYAYIILVTGKTMTADMVEGLEAGADDYLTKPYEKAVLLARINVGTRIVRLEREKNAQLKKIQSTNRKLQQNMESAAGIQLSLLPAKKWNIHNFQFDWIFKPSDTLGGDMLHIYKLSETKVACYVLDVSGHGTDAALLSVTIRNQLTINSDAPKYEETHGSLISANSEQSVPEDVIGQLSNHYGDLLDKTGHYFTIVYGVLDTETGIFEYISAGHYNPILIKGQKFVLSEESSGTPIGMFRDQSYVQQQVKLSQGDRLYLFSDGIVEETNEKEEQFGTDRLVEELKSKPGSPDYLKELLKKAGEWSHADFFKDDVAIVEITHLGNK
ncbi:MAG: SpoIIE family protein phosphatase [Proteobacteria bacterium]|nr:SpoIIE family protein phosphatase [Pseudomonadota bacterium]